MNYRIRLLSLESNTEASDRACQLLIELRDRIQKYLEFDECEPGAIALVTVNGVPLAEILVGAGPFIREDYLTLERLRAVSQKDEEALHVFEVAASSMSPSSYMLLYFEFTDLDEFENCLKYFSYSEIADHGYEAACDLIEDDRPNVAESGDESEGMVTEFEGSLEQVEPMNEATYRALLVVKASYYTYMIYRQMKGGVFGFVLNGRLIAVLRFGDAEFVDDLHSVIIANLKLHLEENDDRVHDYAEVYEDSSRKVIGGIAGADVSNGFTMFKIPKWEPKEGLAEGGTFTGLFADMISLLRQDICPCCGVKAGQRHKWGCPLEECPICGKKIQKCGHCSSRRRPTRWRRKGNSYGPPEEDRILFGAEKSLRDE